MEDAERRRLWESVLPLAYRLAGEMYADRGRGCGRSMTLEDYRQVAALAVWECLRTWNPKKGKLSTHAYWWVRGRILSACSSDDLIRRPGWVAEKNRAARVKQLGVGSRPVIHHIGYELADHHAGDYDGIRRVDDRDEADWLVSQMRPSEQRLVCQILQGKTCAEIDLERGSKVCGRRLGHAASSQLSAAICRIKGKIQSGEIKDGQPSDQLERFKLKKTILTLETRILELEADLEVAHEVIRSLGNRVNAQAELLARLEASGKHPDRAG